MKKIISLSIIFVCLFLFIGCSPSYHADSMDLKSVLVNPKLLQKGTGDQALYRYMNKNVDPAIYTKILLDPVMVAKDGDLDAETRDNYQKLANNAYSLMVKELSKDYKMVTKVGPNTMRLQMVIIDADSSKPARNILSSVTPVGIGIDLIKYGLTGKQSGVGEVSMELKATDSQSGQLLGAVMDRRVGGKTFEGVIDTWADANAGLEYWAKRSRYFLCTARKGKNCINP